MSPASRFSTGRDFPPIFLKVRCVPSGSVWVCSMLLLARSGGWCSACSAGYACACVKLLLVVEGLEGAKTGKALCIRRVCLAVFPDDRPCVQQSLPFFGRMLPRRPGLTPGYLPEYHLNNLVWLPSIHPSISEKILLGTWAPSRMLPKQSGFGTRVFTRVVPELSDFGSRVSTRGLPKQYGLVHGYLPGH